jgi:hypothetical protein
LTTHDVLSYAVATSTIQDIRAQSPDWAHLFSPSAHIVSSRAWPQPDWVVVDETTGILLAAEFKPPAQTKREYLTGVGQAVAYTRDFNYAALVMPQYADDGYNIGQHVFDVLDQTLYDAAPIALMTYDPAVLSPANPGCNLIRPLTSRTAPLITSPNVTDSFYAKWRDASPEELGLFLEYLYDEGRAVNAVGTVRDRAFDRLWADMVAGSTRNWSDNHRRINANHRVAWGKNYRNFVTHLDWILPGGALTGTGLEALHIVHRYGHRSQVFLDLLARAVLLPGKHLVLVNAISRYQDGGPIPGVEQDWLDGVEQYLEDEGLLKRNPGRHSAAIQNVARGFLKAEKTLWRRLGLIVPRGGRVFHPGRGFIFNWERITGLVG